MVGTSKDCLDIPEAARWKAFLSTDFSPFPKGYVMPDKVVNELQFSFADISYNSLHPTDDASGYYLDSYEYSRSLYGNEPHILYGKGKIGRAHV